jgi:hypothetical protein
MPLLSLSQVHLIEFDEIFPHPSGDVEAVLIKGDNGDDNCMLWRIKKGTSYPQGTHTTARRLLILKGYGILNLDGKKIPYHIHSHFKIGVGVSYGFVSVKADTIVAQLQ